MVNKKDYYIAALVGFLTGIFAILMFFNLGLRNKEFLFALPLTIPFVFAFGVWFGKFLSRWMPFMEQFARFVAVGFLNTAIDFGLLNVFSLLTSITAGLKVGGVNVPGFVVAVLNSYFWNKLWVFKDRSDRNAMADFPKFLAVTVIGLFINSGLVILITTYVAPFAGILNPTAWLNVAKALAAPISLIWNFAGFKFLVFRSKKPDNAGGIV